MDVLNYQFLQILVTFGIVAVVFFLILGFSALAMYLMPSRIGGFVDRNPVATWVLVCLWFCFLLSVVINAIT